jgi:predicted metal-dependent phosphotriesterase family hydrolase
VVRPKRAVVLTGKEVCWMESHEGRGEPGAEGGLAARVVQTVTGQIPAEQLGFTLPHEHTYIDLWLIAGRYDYFMTLPDEELLTEELMEFGNRGGRSVVDLTVRGISRNPEGLRRLSERTGLSIVMGMGWYREPYYPEESRINQRSVDSLAEEMIREFNEGVDGTGIRPGVIGEIGVDKPWVSAQEERVCRAAARAQLATGLTIVTHSPRSEVGLAQLAIFEEEGVDPGRVIIGHADSHPMLSYHLEIVKRGASLAFDSLGEVPVDHFEPRLIRLLLELIERGYADRIFLSQDTCHTRHLKAFGGNGYSYLIEYFFPRIREAGVSQEVVEQMTIANPRRAFAIGA